MSTRIPNTERKHTLVLDLDGTLIPEETSKRIFREAYRNTVKELEKRGIEIPEHLREHGKNWPSAFEIPEFRQTFSSIYFEIISSYDFTKEKKRAIDILEFLRRNYNGDCRFIILTANQYGSAIVGKLKLPEDYPVEVISIHPELESRGHCYRNRETFFEIYVELKANHLRRINEENHNTHYIGDLDEDRLVAERAGVPFTNIKDIERFLYSV